MVSGLLWKEMVAQGMARSRTEAARLVKERAVQYEVSPKVRGIADHSELDLPGKTVVRVGKHMFRCVPRLNGSGFDQLRGRIEIPVTPPEDSSGCILIRFGSSGTTDGANGGSFLTKLWNWLKSLFS